MSKSGRIGADWERRVAEYFAAHGFPYAERRVTNGAKDRGDLSGIPGVMVECKAEKQIHLSEYMSEVAVQKANAGASVGVAVIKRRSHGVEKAYVVLELRDFVDLIH